MPFSASLQDQWKQFRVDPAERGSSIGGANTLGGSGGMLPREILKFSFSKTHIWRNLWENERTEMNQNLRWRCTCKKFETPNVKRVTTASLLKLYFCSLHKQKMNMDISSDSSSVRRRHSHWSILALQFWFALHRPCVRWGILTILDLELLYRYVIL